MRLSGQNIRPTCRQATRCLLARIEAVKENLPFVPTHPFHGSVRVSGPLARRGAQTVGVVGHHHFVLSLGDLVLAQVESFGQGHVVLGLVRLSACLARRATHGEAAGFHPNHFQVYGGVEIHEVIGLAQERKWIERQPFPPN